MVILISLLSGGILLGWISRRLMFSWVNKVITMLVWLLLYILGLEVGANDKIIRGFYHLGIEALGIAIAGLLGSMFAAFLLQKLILGNQKTNEKEQQLSIEESEKELTIRLERDSNVESKEENEETKPNLWGSIIIVLWFIFGVCCSMYHQLPGGQVDPQWGFIALCTLIAFVGFSVGHDPMLNTYLKGLNIRLLLLPVMTIIGTLAGTLLIGLIWHQHAISEYLALGSGFGYYSLSSILITQYKTAELGTIALLANIIREMCALLLAPLIVKVFGHLALISAGGATSMDTTLPIITQYAGKQYIGLSVMHGILCDFSVPFLVTLFCTF